MFHDTDTPQWALVYSGSEFLIILCVRIFRNDLPQRSALFISRRIPVNDIETPMASLILYMLLNDDKQATDLAAECTDYQKISRFTQEYQLKASGSNMSLVDAHRDECVSQSTVAEVCTLISARIMNNHILGSL